ncbi:retropepsin-like aspartic protease [Stenotrophomonas sp. PS02289]|uniref:retropepsin-like aspartic protease n=1 Tax=Stenotrophomonas sp. PS02289 TaxID=2991422 RepID=UPI00249A838B|nr:retropepsin-like aspartic protease [Stenotrophomonas sp. PS02289]
MDYGNVKGRTMKSPARPLAPWLFAAAMASSTCAPAIAREVVAEDSDGITLAVMRGDRNTLERVGKTNGPVRLAARAGYYRVRGDLPQSNKWADACIADAAVKAAPTQTVMYLCRSLRAGNRLLANDIAGWASEMLQVRGIFQEHLAPKMPADAEVPTLSRLTFEQFLSVPESGVLATPVSPGTRFTVSDRAGLPVITGKIEGGTDGTTRNIDTDFIIDTGASRSHISRKAAQAMRLSITDGFGYDSTKPGHPVLIGLAAPVDVRLGNVLLRNVSFTVTDDIPFVMLGLDVIQRLGPFVLKEDQLETLASVPQSICQQTATFTSSLWGTQNSLRVPMRIGKRDSLVLLDTGSDVPLEMSGVTLANYPKEGLIEKQRLTMHGNNRVTYAEATAAVTFNGATANLPTHMVEQPGQVYPISWKVGYGLRKQFDFYVDVSGGRGCLHSKRQLPEEGAVVKALNEEIEREADKAAAASDAAAEAALAAPPASSPARKPATED